MMILCSCSLGGVCGATSLDLDQEDPPERTKLDDPHVLSGTYNLSMFYFTSYTCCVMMSYSALFIHSTVLMLKLLSEPGYVNMNQFKHFF